METKISKELIEKAEKIIGDDTGYIDSLETLIESAKMSTYYVWIEKLCKDRINSERIFYNLHLHYLDGDYYLERIILFLEYNKNADTSGTIDHIKAMADQNQINMLKNN